MATGDTDDSKTTDPEDPGVKESHRETSDENKLQPKPGPTKIPEDPGHLRKREDYFRKRSS